jgi:hypothetical protein
VCALMQMDLTFRHCAIGRHHALQKGNSIVYTVFDLFGGVPLNDLDTERGFGIFLRQNGFGAGELMFLVSL